MYNYSPLESIRIKNFRNLGDVSLDFNESPIITLLGENEAGKTSVIKAFSMCALHDSPKDQKDYIRDGTSSLAIQICLKDGTQITRYKDTKGANIYNVVDKNGEQWQTNKITDGLPEPVARQMGLTVEPETGEYLNVRTYEDKLLFVVTPASVNYKVMYNALKVEQLTKAIKLGSTEVNTLRNEIGKNIDSANTLHERLKDINVLDLEAASSLKNSLRKQLEVLDKLEKLNNMIAQLEEMNAKLGALALIDAYNLQPVSEVVINKINNINRLINDKTEVDRQIAIYDKLNTLDNIDINVFNKLNILQGKIAELANKNREASIVEPVNSLESVNEVAIVRIDRLLQKLNEYNTAKKQLDIYNQADSCSEVSIDTYNKITKLIDSINKSKENDMQLANLNNYIEQVQTYLKNNGVAVETCPKCGEAVIIDIDKINGSPVT